MSKIWIAIICLLIVVCGLLYFSPTLNRGVLRFLSRRDIQSSKAENFSSWKEFVPSSGLFKVKLPSEPQYARDYIPIPDSDKKRRYDMYASEKIDGTLFLVTMISYPDDADNSLPENILRQTVDEFMRSKPDNQLSKLQNSLDKENSLDFSIESKDFHIEGRIFLEGKIVYNLTYISRIDSFDPSEYQYFIDSFKEQKIESKPLLKK